MILFHSAVLSFCHFVSKKSKKILLSVGQVPWIICISEDKVFPRSNSDEASLYDPHVHNKMTKTEHIRIQFLPSNDILA